jgi:hypothetical protein
MPSVLYTYMCLLYPGFIKKNYSGMFFVRTKLIYGCYFVCSGNHNSFQFFMFGKVIQRLKTGNCFDDLGIPMIYKLHFFEGDNDDLCIIMCMSHFVARAFIH